MHEGADRPDVRPRFSMNASPVTPVSRRIAALVVLVLGLHAALLALPVRSARANSGAAASGLLQVRMLAAATVTTPQAAQAPAAVREVTERVVVPAQPVLETTPRVPDAQVAELDSVGQPVELTPPMPLFGLALQGIDSDDDYFPRAMLTVVPTPIEPVMIAYPEFDNDPGHHSSELALFIDETGRVARVRFDGPELPRELEEAARNAFITARFRSGELDGRAVKSWIRVEVVFDSRTTG